MARAKNDEQHPAIAFLRALYALTPGGYVELRAIPVDRASISKPRRIFARTPPEVVDFANRYGGKDSPFGVYFGICKREAEDGTKKAISRIPALWADVDTVKNGWDTDAMLKMLHAVPGVLRPSACVRSGGGLHLYWFINDTEIDQKTIEATNVVLRDVFAGDAVQNVDRIFRLPGTFNTKRKAARVEVAWCYGFERKTHNDLVVAAQLQKKWIGSDGKWTSLGAIKKTTKPFTVDPMQKFVDVYGEGSRVATKSTKEMWRDRVKFHAPRGYIGIHEAALIHTARLYMSNKDMPESEVVRVVMREIETIKNRDAHDEQWDMQKEADTVRGMFRTWQPKWKEFVRERGRERAAERKKNGRPSGVRDSR